MSSRATGGQFGLDTTALCAANATLVSLGGSAAHAVKRPGGQFGFAKIVV